MKLENVEQTCFAVPSQWEADTDNGLKVYIRYRHGNFTVGIGETVDDAVGNTIYQESIGDGLDGVMETSKMLEIVNKLNPPYKK